MTDFFNDKSQIANPDRTSHLRSAPARHNRAETAGPRHRATALAVEGEAHVDQAASVAIDRDA
jgi:hypothetical protein